MAARLFEKIITFLFDIFAITVAFYTTFWIRYHSNLFPETYDPTKEFSGIVTWLMYVITALWLLLFFLNGLYRTWYKESRLDELLVVFRTICIGLGILFIIISADELIKFATEGKPPRLFHRTQFAGFITYGVCIMVFATAGRFIMHTLLTWLFCRGIGVSNMLIVGANSSGANLLNQIAKYPQLGYRIKGFIDDDGRKRGSQFENLPVFGTYSELQHICRKHSIHGIIISSVSSSPREIERIVNCCGDLRLDIYMEPSLLDVISGHLKTHQIFGVPLLLLLHDHMPAWEAQVKRLIDIIVSTLVLLLGLPIWLAVAIAIKINSAGPVIYKQERVGKNGKIFTMFKFRSMYQDAEKYSGPVWAKQKDPRITAVGRFIRKTRIDEIPQFINVLKGEMSIVGPRPERKYFMDQLIKEIPWYVRRIKMKPGITGWAQVKHKYDESIEDVKKKVTYDLYYFENMSLLLDIKIILRTIWVVLLGKGAH